MHKVRVRDESPTPMITDSGKVAESRTLALVSDPGQGSEGYQSGKTTGSKAMDFVRQQLLKYVLWCRKNNTTTTVT